MSAGGLLVPSQSIPTGTTLFTLGPQPAGQPTAANVGLDPSRINLMVAMLTCTVAGTSVNVYFQHSVDGGVSWDDFISFTQLTATSTGVIAQWDRDAVSASAVHARSDGALAAGVINGPVGDNWRIKAVVVAGPFTIAVQARQIQRTR